MTKEEKLDKICKDFSSLSEDKQEYILGMLQALVFANSENELAQVGISSEKDTNNCRQRQTPKRKGA
jgi:hypothetical protein